MDGINQLDLITQRILSLHAKTLEDQLRSALTELAQAQQRIIELEMPPAAETSEGA